MRTNRSAAGNRRFTPIGRPDHPARGGFGFLSFRAALACIVDRLEAGLEHGRHSKLLRSLSNADMRASRGRPSHRTAGDIFVLRWRSIRHGIGSLAELCAPHYARGMSAA
jgi:hypothetical protein